MSGLLQRLAARAIGLPPTVRPSSRLPYAPAPALVESTQHFTVAPLMQSQQLAQTQSQPPPAAVSASPIPSKVTTSRVAYQGIDGAPEPSSAPAPTDLRQNTKGMDNPKGRNPPLRAAEPAPQPFQGQLAVEPLVPGPGPGIAPPGSEGSLQANTGGPAGDPGQAQATEPVRSDAEASFQMILHQVEPLVPAPPGDRRGIRAGMGPQPASLRALSAQGQVEETTEVHVNIGRIEVMAMHEAAAAKRPLQEQPRMMTLDDYLSGRRGGGR